MFLKQGSTIWTLYSNITANMTCQNDRVTHKNWRHVTLNRTFLNESKKSSFIIKDVITMSFPEFTDSLLIPPYKGPTYLIEKYYSNRMTTHVVYLMCSITRTMR
uniref:Uncharacterized protein n=1 Tax=Rhipicephalus microplus TaxID=6941 RepID=A0A6G5AHP9_RHIMP